MVRHGLWQCLDAEEALDVVRLLCYETLHVRLCQLGPASSGGPSVVFLVTKEVSSRG